MADAKRTIPELREAIRNIATCVEHGLTLNLCARQLRQIADELVRRSPARRKAPTIHRPLTERQKQEIRSFAFSPAGTKMHIADIAVRFNVNPGRVSEAIHGE